MRMSIPLINLWLELYPPLRGDNCPTMTIGSYSVLTLFFLEHGSPSPLIFWPHHRLAWPHRNISRNLFQFIAGWKRLNFWILIMVSIIPIQLGSIIPYIRETTTVFFIAHMDPIPKSTIIFCQALICRNLSSFAFFFSMLRIQVMQFFSMLPIMQAARSFYCIP